MFTLPELLKKMQVEGGHLGQLRPDERADASRRTAVARVAYHSAKILDESQVPITQADADYICEVIASRVGSVTE